mmetsp:Transcript_1690/g.5262  ORF Transcript_1690/g.5262 Transcript_1690/m.5262 type:complete len:309 (+) Transcript_1690:96-1022(+)
MPRRAWAAALLPACAQALSLQPHARQFQEEPLSCTVQVLRQFPHASRPFTQGLELAGDGQLVETSGDFPPDTGSFVRLMDPQRGLETLRTADGLRGQSVPHKSKFVEGITEMNGHWFASTYKDGVVLEYDDKFNYLASYPFPYEGWGLTHSLDGGSFLATNSTASLMTVEPASFRVTDVKTVTCLGKPVAGLNELEMVPDFLGRGPALLGNVINTRLVLAVDPATARCLAVMSLAGGGLERERESEQFGYHVANGIAFNRQSGTFFVTGKNWRSMFEVQFREDSGQKLALQALRRHLARSGAEELPQR